MDDESSRDIRLIQSYDEDEIGSKMTTNFIERYDKAQKSSQFVKIFKESFTKWHMWYKINIFMCIGFFLSFIHMFII